MSSKLSLLDVHDMFKADGHDPSPEQLVGVREDAATLRAYLLSLDEIAAIRSALACAPSHDVAVTGRICGRCGHLSEQHGKVEGCHNCECDSAPAVRRPSREALIREMREAFERGASMAQPGDTGLVCGERNWNLVADKVLALFDGERQEAREIEAEADARGDRLLIQMHEQKARAERLERIVEAVKALCIEETRYWVGGDRVSQFITKIINAIADSH